MIAPSQPGRRLHPTTTLWIAILDTRVERTRDRPLPSGQVTPLQALAFLFLQCLVGCVLLQFNGFAIASGFASVAIVLVYPFMKRVIWMPQIVLGFASRGAP